MNSIINPVAKYYKNYKFNVLLPVITHGNYTDLLNNAKSITKSCILLNTTPVSVDTKLNINLSYPQGIEVVLILNINLIGKSQLNTQGNNYTISNVGFTGGDKNYSYPGYPVYIHSQNLKLVNFI